MLARLSVSARLALAAVMPIAAAPASADTAAPFNTVFGRLVVPALPDSGSRLAPPADASETSLPTGAGAERQAAIDCLALAITYEAGHEPLAGQAAVAQVILNRVRHPAFPKSVCGVVYQGAGRHTGCQFSFTCDGSLARRRDPRVWSQALAIAGAVLDGQRNETVGGATFYHANYVSPYWAPALVRVASIGAHIFYRFPGALAAPDLAGRETAVPPPRNNPVFAPWGLVVIGRPPS